jgi:hypothetical protein
MSQEPPRRRRWREIKWSTWGLAMAILVAAAVIFVVWSVAARNT